MLSSRHNLGLAPRFQCASNNMDNPPAPPSPSDEDIRDRKHAEVRKHIVRLLKQRFPHLPY